MVTRLFLHAATSGVSGTLPTSEQSTLTSGNDFEANQATNRSMSRFRGTSQTSLANASTATVSLVNYYIGRWVSDPLNQSGLAANNWTLNAAYKQDNSTAKFPVSAQTDNDIYLNIYVWRPSNGTKVGTIVDANITSTDFGGTSSGAETTWIAPIAGSAVAGTQAGDVIIVEVWTTTTQTDAVSHTQTFYFDGTIVTTGNTAGVSNHASFLETPENIVFTDTYSPTKFYLHAASSGVSGTLPTTEQSAKTSSVNVDAQTVNRSMNTTIGASQATLTLTSTATVLSTTYYFTKFVSPLIYQTSIPAGIWEYNFAARESNTSANFPVTASNKAVAMSCYVWKPSNGTKYGDILDGNTTGATVSEGAANTEKSQQVEFSGALVSGLTSGDAVIVFEVWFVIAQGLATAYTDDFFYDGTTETAGGSTVSNHASFLNCLGVGLNLSGGPTTYQRTIAETLTITDAITRKLTAKRPIAETLSLADTITDKKTGKRTIAETLTLTDTITRKLTAKRVIAEALNLIDTITRKLTAKRNIAETFTLADTIIEKKTAKGIITEVLSLVETIARKLTAKRTINETLTLTDNIIAKKKALALIAETFTLTDIISRKLTAKRAINETLGLTHDITKMKKAFATIAEALILSDNIVAAKKTDVMIAEVFSLIDTITRKLTAKRNIAESLGLIDDINVIKKAFVVISETLGLSDSITAGKITAVNISETLGLTETITAVKKAIRLITENLNLAHTIDRKLTAKRAIAEALSMTDNISAGKKSIVAISEALILVDNITRRYGAKRTIAETLGLTHDITALKKTFVIISETLGLTDDVNRKLTARRTIAETFTLADMMTAITTTPAQTFFVNIVEAFNLIDTIETKATKHASINENLILLSDIKAIKKAFVNIAETFGLIDEIKAQIVEPPPPPPPDSGGPVPGIIRINFRQLARAVMKRFLPKEPVILDEPVKQLPKKFFIQLFETLRLIDEIQARGIYRPRPYIPPEAASVISEDLGLAVDMSVKVYRPGRLRILNEIYASLKALDDIEATEIAIAESNINRTKASRESRKLEEQLAKELSIKLDKMVNDANKRGLTLDQLKQKYGAGIYSTIRTTIQKSYEVGASYVGKATKEKKIFLSGTDINNIKQQSDRINTTFWRKVEGKLKALSVNRAIDTLPTTLALTLTRERELKNTTIANSVSNLATSGLLALATLSKLQQIPAEDIGYGPGTTINEDGLLEIEKRIVTFETEGDDNVCPICEQYEGQEWEEDDPFIIMPVEDTHDNCRCRLLLDTGEEL